MSRSSLRWLTRTAAPREPIPAGAAVAALVEDQHGQAAGVVGDGITNKMQPAFSGVAEPNARCRP